VPVSDIPQYKIISTITDLQKALFVRGVVFINEQKCPWDEEFDEFDLSSLHFLGTIHNEPVSTARIRFVDNYIKLERLAVRKEFRGQNIGKGMLSFVLSYIDNLKAEKIVLHAQSYLLDFYQNFGFIKHGEAFKEVNIEHFYMEKLKNTNKDSFFI
jgi:predicted GNAT family N-acyltransferase